MELERSSGILLHITSLPSPFGIGDIGPSAYEFVDFLEASGHRYWQLLPLNPTDAAYSHSPYSSYSAFAGNPLLISPELLEKAGYVDLDDFPKKKKFSESRVEFEVVQEYKEKILDAAFEKFSKKKPGRAFTSFTKKHDSWLDDYSLYKSLRRKFDNAGWFSWPAELRDRKPKALKEARKELADDILKEKFIQFLFFSQWEDLVEYAHKKEVYFFGDIPFYINHDSADCWSHASYFKLDEEKKPTKISGVPPDYFSETGQLWGTPVYEWKALKENKFDWWVERIQQNLLLFDLVRLDHFRAFAAYWEVPAEDETAINGKWVKSPGTQFFNLLKKDFPNMPLIAEDLGLLDEPVYELLEKFDFPGMRVLHFAFGEDRKDNPYLPFNHVPNTVVYTGTHDNNTSVGWYQSAGRVEKRHLKDYTGTRLTSKNVHKVLHRIALDSVAKLAVVPLQDLHGLGEEAIMNTPGTTKNNWSWRATGKQVPHEMAGDLKKLNELFGRIVKTSQEPTEKGTGTD